MIMLLISEEENMYSNPLHTFVPNIINILIYQPLECTKSYTKKSVTIPTDYELFA